MDETVTIMVASGPEAPPQPVEIPRRVGNVKIGALLGEGAGGTVLAGFDAALGRPVAVKVLHRRGGPGGEHAMSEIVQGIRAAASVKHPNVVTVYSVEPLGGLAVIVMELVDGASLREILKRSGAMDAALAVFVLESAARGAEALHRAGVLHRDLKPANILFDRSGEAHVCDFGLACGFDAAGFRSDATNIGGSPLYMAPEMFDGHVSFQSDVYALGMMLFEVLCGQAPFAGTTISEVRALHQRGELPLQRLRQRGLSEELVNVIERALNRRRIMRFKTAGHFLRALEALSDSSQREALRQRLAATVTVIGGLPEKADAPGVASSPAQTTFDLVAARAAEKRHTRRSS